MSVGIILQLILPSFGVHIFEKEFILLPAIFVVYTYFTLRKYYFNPVGASNSAFLSFFFASTFALLVVGFGEFLHSQGVSMGSYWQFPDPYDL